MAIFLALFAVGYGGMFPSEPNGYNPFRDLELERELIRMPKIGVVTKTSMAEAKQYRMIMARLLRENH